MIIEDIKNKLLEEISAAGANTFMYNLHYEGHFDCRKLDNLLDVFGKYLTINDGKIDDDNNTIIKGMVKSFLHILFLLHCNNSKEDLYKIKNEQQITDDIISDYYSKMRTLIELAYKKSALSAC